MNRQVVSSFVNAKATALALADSIGSRAVYEGCAAMYVGLNDLGSVLVLRWDGTVEVIDPVKVDS